MPVILGSPDGGYLLCGEWADVGLAPPVRDGPVILCRKGLPVPTRRLGVLQVGLVFGISKPSLHLLLKLRGHRLQLLNTPRRPNEGPKLLVFLQPVETESQ